MKIKWWSAILAVWIWWMITIQSHEICLSTFDPLTADPPEHPKITFDASNADGETYQEMIRRLRETLIANGGYSHGIPRLPDPSTVSDSERYILLRVTEARGHAVTFAIDVTNVYIVGYRVGNQRYFFSEAAANAPDFLFTDVTTPLPARRSSNYNNLESRAGVERKNISLGLQAFLGAISTLTSQPEDPRSLMISIQMISEAARYWEIESRVLHYPAFLPDAYMLDLETNWGGLSRQIQMSEFFAFQRAITIGSRLADNINSYVIAGMYLMLFVCNPPTPKTSSIFSFVSHLELIINQQSPSNLGVAEEEEKETCEHLVEPRTRIRGRNGLCVDVEGFVYRDNTPIILFHCRTSDFKNQLWTLTKNGRIQSLEKCFAASGTTPGSPVVIHECETLNDSALGWAMLDSGTLVNKHSGLHLTAKDGSEGSKLTLEKNDYSSFQSWKATNDLTPVDVYILGENNQCIYYNGNYGVYVETCNKGSSTQKWRLYPDSTIRPMDWLDGCMEIARLSGDWIYVQAGCCSGSPELHKWIFAHDGSIMNWKSGRVVDASKTYPGYLYAWPFSGSSNQLWTLEFI